MRLALPALLLLTSCPQTNTCTSNADCGSPRPTCDSQCGTCVDPCAVDADCTAPETCLPSSCGTGQAACALPETGGSGGKGGMAGAGGTGGEAGAP